MTEQHGGVSFAVDEETRLILDSIDEFVGQEVKPREQELGEMFDNPRLRNDPDGAVAPEVIKAVDEVRRASGEAGFYAMNMPEEYGGQDVSNVTWYRAKRHVAEKGRGLSEFMLAGPEGPKPLLLRRRVNRQSGTSSRAYAARRRLRSRSRSRRSVRTRRG